MKKHLLAVMACAAALSVYGCSSQPEETTAAAETTAESAEETTNASEESEESADSEAAKTASVDGLVVDASMNTLTIQIPGTGLVSFDTSSVEEKELADGLLIGNIVEVSYTGEMDAAEVTKLADSEITPALATDRLQFAADILMAVHARDLELLAGFTNYPVYVDLEGASETGSAEDLIALGAETVLTDELVEAVTTADLLTLEEVEAGVVMGNDDGFNIIFKENEDGNLGITGINYGE